MSQLTINTKRLQSAVSDSIKASGFNKLLPVTGMIGVKHEGDVLTFMTTDGTNYMYRRIPDVEGDDFNVVVDADVFSKLISKFSVDETEFCVTDDYLLIEGDGEYKLALQLNDAGDILTYPDPLKDIPIEISDKKISKASIDVLLMSLKPSLSTVSGSIYENYFVGDFVASTDGAMMAIFENSLLDGDTYLFTRGFVDLLGLAQEDIDFSVSGDYIIAKSGSLTVVSTNNLSHKEYDSSALKRTKDFEADSYCKVSKQELLSALERLAIFVTDYDYSGINIKFVNDGIEFSSVNSSGIEAVEFTESKGAKDFTAKINVLRLITQVKAYKSDVVEIYYGHPSVIKLVDGNLTQILAFMK